MTFDEVPFGVLCYGRRLDRSWMKFYRVRDGREHNQIFVPGEDNGVLLSLNEAQFVPHDDGFHLVER